MKKRSGELSLKIAAMALALISGVGLVVSGGSMLVSAECRYWEENIDSIFEKRLLEQYGYALLDKNVNSEERDWSGLDGGPINYLVTKGEDNKVIYGDETLLEAAEVKVSASKGDVIQYSLSSLEAGLFHDGYAYGRNDEERREYGLEDIYYDKESGLFYGKYEIGYYPVLKFNIRQQKEGDTGEYVEDYNYNFQAEEKDGRYVYIERNGKSDFIGSFITEAGYLQLGEDEIDTFYLDITEEEKVVYGSEAESFYTIRDKVEDSELITSNYKNVYLDGDWIEVSNSEDAEEEDVDSFQVYLSYQERYVNVKTFKGGLNNYFPQMKNLLGLAKGVIFIQVPLFILSLILMIVACGILCCQAGHRPEDNDIHLRFMDKCPYFIYLCLACGGIGGGIAGNFGLAYLIYHGILSFAEFVALSLLCYALWMLLAIAIVLSTIVRIKGKVFWKYSVCGYCVAPFRLFSNRVDEKVSISWKLYVGFFLLTCLELLIIGTTEYEVGAEIFFFFVIKAIEFLLMLRILKQLKVLQLGGERIAKGDYNHPINTSKMSHAFKEHGDNLNHVGDGIAKAVEVQMKSERFQTELITNVSHDIKTPLTSIINYVDLMKKEDITDPTMQEYVDVLYRQSNRLKKLIEDLIEASKASTGSLSVNMEAIDAVVMLDQVVGEFKEKLNAQGLEVVVNKPDMPVIIMADGRHFWRVLDNLMSNVCKYAQPGTRVYVDMNKSGGWVQMQFRNVSREMLNISADELLERFVRGDSSRNSDGHGLGLNIAESLTKLMGGNLHIEIDADLFKVKVFFPEAKQNLE